MNPTLPRAGRTKPASKVTWAEVNKALNEVLGNGAYDIRSAVLRLVARELVHSYPDIDEAVVEKFQNDLSTQLVRLLDGEEVVRVVSAPSARKQPRTSDPKSPVNSASTPSQHMLVSSPSVVSDSFNLADEETGKYGAMGVPDEEVAILFDRSGMGASAEAMYGGNMISVADPDDDMLLSSPPPAPAPATPLSANPRFCNHGKGGKLTYKSICTICNDCGHGRIAANCGTCRCSSR